MIKKITLTFGVIFCVFGLLGFLPNPIVGSRAFFEADFLHNIIHLFAGLGLVFAAFKGMEYSLKALKFFGWYFLLLSVFGFFAGNEQIFGFMETNFKDAWLHLFAGGLLLFYAEKFVKE